MFYRLMFSMRRGKYIMHMSQRSYHSSNKKLTSLLVNKKLRSPFGINTFEHQTQSLIEPILSYQRLRYISLSLKRFADETIDVHTPEFPDSISEGDVKWMKNVGDAVKVDEVVGEIETEKTALPVPAPENGIILEQYVKNGETIRNGAKLFKLKIVRDGAAAAPAKPLEKKPEEPAPAPKPAAPSPALSPPTPTPTAPSIAPQPVAPPPLPKITTPVPSTKPATEPTPKVQPTDPTSKISGTRKDIKIHIDATQKQLVQELQTIHSTSVMLTTMHEVDMGSWFEFEDRVQKDFQKKFGVKLTYLTAFCKSAAYSLTHKPIINAVVEGDDLIYRDYVDMHVSIPSPKGMLYPVIKSIEFMSYGSIATWLYHFQAYAEKGTIEEAHMGKGTFTVTDLGHFGNVVGSPMLRTAESCTLELNQIVKRPVWIKNDFEPHPVMYIALCYDSRFIGPAEASSFLTSIKKCMEEPFTLLSGL